eukprot:1413144-Rhodomonas_salina.1
MTEAEAETETMPASRACEPHTLAQYRTARISCVAPYPSSAPSPRETRACPTTSRGSNGTASGIPAWEGLGLWNFDLSRSGDIQQE